MIQRKRKICKGCNTPQYLFGHGLCRSCYDKEHRRPLRVSQKPQKPRSPLRRGKTPLKSKSGFKQQKTLSNRTEKRAGQEREYAVVCREMDREAKETGNLECFFCGEMVVNADHHHLDGREGEALTDKTKIVRVHRRCHRQYHDVPVAKIPWFEGFLYRLMLHNIELYNKEILKLEK